MLADTFTIADADYVVNRGITKLFGVDVVFEGPMFLPTAQTFSEFDNNNHLSEETFPAKGYNFEDRYAGNGHLSGETFAAKGHNFEGTYAEQTHTYTGHVGDIHKEIEDMEMSRAIEESLMESKLHEKQANFLGNNDTETDSAQTDKHWAGTRRSPTSSFDDDGVEDSKTIGASRFEDDGHRTEKINVRKAELNDIDRKETISTPRRGRDVSSGMALDPSRTRTSFPEDIPGEFDDVDMEKVATSPTHEMTNSVTSHKPTRHKHIPEVYHVFILSFNFCA